MLANNNTHLVVFSSLFPHPGAPHAGVFIRERMFRVAREQPVTIVSPQPWFPLQSVVRCFRTNYRLCGPKHEVQQGIEVFRPRFLSIPGLFRHWDGFFMALFSLPTLRRLKAANRLGIIDAHFGYPDGYAATLLARWIKCPVTVTLRGTEIRHSNYPQIRSRLKAALNHATEIFSVSASLKNHAISLGVEASKIHVIGNGVDVDKFVAVNREQARARFNIPVTAKVLISVGGLVERKGFHRVLNCLPSLIRDFPDLHYVIVGGPSPEGDMTSQLHSQVSALGLAAHVHFLGTVPPEELRWPLSAADIFVLATRNEGWANVFLEAMACGLPVVTTDVGGNREVVCNENLGTIVGFNDQAGLKNALREALSKKWDQEAIVHYARSNDWSKRVSMLRQRFGIISDTWKNNHKAGTSSMKGINL